MSTVRLRRKLDSETLHLPELRSLIGKTVDITIVERTATKSTPSADAQSVPTHTSRPLTPAEMTQELDAMSHPTPHPSVPLKHKVDYSQVF